MADYDYRNFSDGLLQNRFTNFAGADIWRDLVESPNLKSLNELRSFNSRDWRRMLKKGLTKPRVFISHRRSDLAPALEVKNAADANGFDYWLDVEDPKLSALGYHPDKKAVAVLTAAIIEMALINCTHVLAVMTPSTAGSLWVPYEYGRITEFPTVHGRAAAWLHSNLPQPPEYLLLGVITNTIDEIENWFRSEATAWH